MGVQPHISYERTFGMGNAVLPKLRKLMGGDTLAWNDRELRNILDMAVDKQIRAKNAEEWWEDDWAYGISLNRVVRIDEMLPVGYNYNIPPLYAIVRRGSQGDIDIIIAIVDQDDYDKSILERRWTETKPEKSKYRHPGESEDEDEAAPEYEPPHDPKHEENLMATASAAQNPNGVVVAIEDPAVLIVCYGVDVDPDSTGLQEATVLACKQSEMEQRIFELIARGVRPERMTVCRNINRVQLGISLRPS